MFAIAFDIAIDIGIGLGFLCESRKGYEREQRNCLYLLEKVIHVKFHSLSVNRNNVR
jgi:hypothetical protein